VSAPSGQPARGLALAVAWLVVVLVFWFGLFVPSMDPGLRRPIDIDLYGYFHPKFWYGTAELLAGRLPTWNPYEYSGLPFLATAQPAVLYPPKILAYALVPSHALHAFMVLHYFLAGVFAFVALRGLGLDWPAAMLGTVTWVFAATNLDSHYHPNRIACVVWIPLAFSSFTRVLARPGPRRAAALGLVIALGLLAGYPEYTFDTVLCLVVYWPFAARALARRGEAAPLRRTVGWLAVSAATAAALSALQILPLLELVRESARVSGGTATAPTPPPLATVLAVMPRSLTDLWRDIDLTARALHLPPAAWVLAVVGVVLGRAPMRGPLLAVLAFTTALTTAARLLLQVAPGFALLRPNSCWLSLWYFVVAYMVGSGLELVLARATAPRDERRPRLRLAVVGTVLLASAGLLAPRSWVALGVSLAVLAVAGRPGAWRTPAVLLLAAMTVVSVWTWIPPAIATPSLHRYSRGEAAYPPEPPAPSGLRAALASVCGTGQRVLAPWLAWNGAAVIERVELLEGYPEPLVPGRIDRLLESLGVNAAPLLGSEELARAAAGTRILDLLNVGCVVAPIGVDLPGLGLVRAGALGEHAIYRRNALARARVVHRARVVGDGEAAWQAIHDPTFDPAHEVVLEGDIGDTGAGGGTARVQVEHEETGRIAIAVSTPAAGTLVVAQSFYPGWRARVDDVPVDILRANYTALGVPVSAGEHRVVLAYDPATVRAGEVLLGLGLLTVLGLVLPRRVAKP
jgi:hypothetical protein